MIRSITPTMTGLKTKWTQFNRIINCNFPIFQFFRCGAMQLSMLVAKKTHVLKWRMHANLLNWYWFSFSLDKITNVMSTSQVWICCRYYISVHVRPLTWLVSFPVDWEREKIFTQAIIICWYLILDVAVVVAVECVYVYILLWLIFLLMRWLNTLLYIEQTNGPLKLVKLYHILNA